MAGARVKLGLLISIAVAAVAVVSDASAGTLQDGPAVLRPVKRPPGVPADYVLTHHGFFHPSCVVSVASGDTVGEDAPCAYPRFTASGQPVTQRQQADPANPDPQADWDGWLVYYEAGGQSSIPVAPTLATTWVVPPVPLVESGQDVAFFNDIETTAGGGDILQPVLDFGMYGEWVILAEHYFSATQKDIHSTPLVVSPGDVIRGVVRGRECHADRTCDSWSITATDVTNGLSTMLPAEKAPMGVPSKVDPAVLETYGLSACDMLPPSGEVTFKDNELLDGNGNIQTVDYTLHVRGPRPGVASCGYRGNSAGGAYQLLFPAALGQQSLADFGGPAGCQAVVAGAAAPCDWRLAAALGVLFSLVTLRRLSGGSEPRAVG